MESLLLKMPLFIVFEGIDGSGKSTQAEMLFNYFKDNNKQAVKLYEPSEGDWGRKIRAFLHGGDDFPVDEQLDLFILDRKDDVEKNIKPALKNNKIIIMDRYYYSNAAYQGSAGYEPGYIIEENKKNNFPEPDRVYFMDIDAEEAIKRITNRNSEDSRDIFEKKAFLEKVREIYLSLSDSKFLVIDGNLSRDKIFDIIKTDIKNSFENSKADQ